MALLTGNYISLFAGVAGFDLAVRIAFPGARCVCLIENEVNAAAVLAARIKEGCLDECPIWSDVRSFGGHVFRGSVDGVVGGFPCTDLSVAGRQAGIHGEHSGLWFEYLRIIREVQPRWVAIENVPAVIAFPAGGIVLSGLAQSGFDAEWLSLRASDVGAAHGRNRVFILAHQQAGGRRVLRQPSGSIRLADGSNAGVEVAEHTGGRIETSNRSGGGGSSLGNPDLAGLEGRQQCGCGLSDERVAGATGDPGLADASVAGLSLCDGQRIDAARQRAAEPQRSGRHGLPLFAPGPGATELWQRILAAHPYLAPAISTEEIERIICNLDDGLAAVLVGSRTDGLRACGNGIVAAQAALALTVLARRLDA